MKITIEHSKTIRTLIESNQNSLQDIINYFENRYSLNQIKYHIEKNFKEVKPLLKKEYSRGSNKLIYLLKQIFPSRLVFKEHHIGNKLRLDAYVSAPYNLGFEFDGVQHKQKTSFFHSTEGDFNSAKNRDIEKEERCIGRGIKLIRIDDLDNISLEKLKSLIEESGYGTGEIVDSQFLTNKELIFQSQQNKKEEYKVLRKQKPLDEKKLITQNLLKDKLKQKRKEDYEKAKEWKKTFAEQFRKKSTQS